MKAAMNRANKDQIKQNIELTKKEAEEKIKREAELLKNEKREQKELL